MTVQLTPEDEELVQKRLQSGTFQSISEVIHDALASQDSEADWLVSNKLALDEKINRGIEQLNRGEGSSGEAVYQRLQQRKADWLVKQTNG